jgi:uncharacterized membrane protein
LRLDRAVMGVIYIAAGLGHFLLTPVYLRIMPDYLPAHRTLVLLSGAAEIAGGVGVLAPRTQRIAAIGLALLLAAVFPANLWMVQHPERFAHIPRWVLWARLPLQIPLILWVLAYARRDDPAPVRSRG